MSKNYITVTMFAGILASSCNVNNVFANDASIDYYVHNKISGKCKNMAAIPKIDEYISDSINDIQSISYEDKDNEILTNFVKSITAKSNELDSDFSKFVDDNFWDLV